MCLTTSSSWNPCFLLQKCNRNLLNCRKEAEARDVVCVDRNASVPHVCQPSASALTLYCLELFSHMRFERCVIVRWCVLPVFSLWVKCVLNWSRYSESEEIRVLKPYERRWLIAWTLHYSVRAAFPLKFSSGNIPLRDERMSHAICTHPPQTADWEAT